jgi:hypothetical protein
VRDRTSEDVACGVLRHAAMATTAWGKAKVLETITIDQEAGARSFSTFVQLLETEDGEPLVRFAYGTNGTARRGPVTMRKADLKQMRRALGRAPGLRAALGL